MSSLSLSPLPLAGGRRRSRRHTMKMPSLAGVKSMLKGAGEDAEKVDSASMPVPATMGGRRHRMSAAKKVVKKLRTLAKQTKKLTMRLKKMKTRKH